MGWLLQVASEGYSNGFVAVTVAPDGKSVTINWQLTGTAASVQMIQAGIFGPATKDQVTHDPSSRVHTRVLIFGRRTVELN